MDIPKIVAKLRFMYHSNLLDVNNVLNQLGIMSDETANRNNKRHCMIIMNDILYRLYDKDVVDRFFNK